MARKEEAKSYSTLPPGNDNPTPLDQLAHDLSVSAIAEWLAIQDNKTRLQAEDYWTEAVEFVEYIYLLGYRLVGKSAP